MQRSNLGNFYEDFETGETIEHELSKTIFESDNNIFSLLTMNHHPLHTNSEYAKETIFNKPLVVGTLVFSLAVGITVPDISGKAIANLGYEEITHLKPVFVGDTISVRTEILSKRESNKRPHNGLVTIKSIASNQKGIDVLSFKRTVLVPMRGKDE
jgi:acyl dehydratase